VEFAKLTAAEKSASSSQQCQFHVDLFFDIQSIVHKEFVPLGQTVNGTFYSEVLKRLGEGIRRKRPDKWEKNTWFFRHDMTLVVRKFLTSKNIRVIPPPHSPDLAPCDFILFPKMKLRPKGRLFDTTEEIHAETQEVIDTHLRTAMK
jgi:hypothetical protein